MPYIATTATKKLLKLRKRIRFVSGGTSASKTITILMLLIDDAQTDKEPTLTSVVSESFPHLRRGAMRDFANIMQEQGYWKDAAWSKTDYTYTFPNGSKIEFFSADQPSKVRGPRRDRLFVNELNNIPKEAFEQLLLRTKQYAWGDWNPVSEFYAYTDYIGHRSDVDFTILTYKDNEGLSADIVAEIEARKGNKYFWQVYGLGQLGEAEGRIYTGWKTDISEIPHEARLERYGLDFGYARDPAAIVAVYYYNGGYILDQITYQLGLSNRRLADIIKNLPLATVIADSAEPKSIDELKEYGIGVLPAQKGQGSVNQGINYVGDQKISVTKRSIDLIKEYRNYLWQTDKEGRIIRVPETGMDHALDAVRYAMESLRPVEHDNDYTPQPTINFM